MAVPGGFGGDVKTPKGARLLYRLQVDADDKEGLRDLFSALEGLELRKRSITVEHGVDGAKACYRVVRTSGGSGGTVRSTANWPRASRSCSTGTVGGFRGLAPLPFLTRTRLARTREEKRRTPRVRTHEGFTRTCVR